MAPHVQVHGRSDYYGRGSSKVEGSQEVACETLGELCDDVGGRGSDQQSVNRLRYRDMFDRGIDVGLFRSSGEKIGDDLLAGERSKCERADKLLRGRSHDDLYTDAPVL